MFFTAEQSDEHKNLLEKKAKQKREEDTKELDKVNLEAESWRRDLETRGQKIEAMVTEVIFSFVVKMVYC